MSISNFTFQRIYQEEEKSLINKKISKIIRISATDYAFYLFSKTQESLILSFDNNNPFMFITSSYLKIVSDNSLFFTCLKKYFEGGQIIRIEKLPSDKIVTFYVNKLTPSYQYITSKLIVELIPFKANAIITDENDVIINSLKTSITLDDPHLICKGVKYLYQEKPNNDYYLDDTLDSLKYKTPKVVYQEIAKRVNKDIPLPKIIQEIKNETKFYLYGNDILSLKIDSDLCQEITLEDLSKLYFAKEQEKYKKSHYDLVYKTIDHKLKGLRNKLVNLKQDLKKAEEKISYVQYGDLLYMYMDLYQRGASSITLEGKTISLDPKLDLVGNANKYYKLYQKSKVALEQIKIQEDLTKEKISYFEKLALQVKYANDEDMLDIIKELQNDNYLPKDKEKRNKKQTPTYPYKTLITTDNYKIGWGISSLQNDYLTFTIARKEDYFLHILNDHGPHVIIFSNNPSQEALLMASEIALYFANKQEGDIMVASRKDVKKIPGILGKVTLDKYQTIHLNKIREESLKILEKYTKQ